jgi:hypothetical protein
MDKDNKNENVDNTDKKLHISDVMCSDFEKELVRHNFYITLIHKELMKGVITKEEFINKQEEDIKMTSKILGDIVRNHYT